MANVKISDLPVASNVTSEDTFPFVQGATTKQASKSVLFTSPTFTGDVNLTDLSATTSLALDGSKNIVSVINTGSGSNVLATSPVLVTPDLGTPSAATLTNATGLPISTGVSGLGTGVATALETAIGSAGAFVANGGALGTPSSGTVTNLTGTASININGTVGATTPNSGAFTTLSASSTATAASFIPTSSSAPTNGMYLSAANQLSLSTNSGERIRVSSAGQFLLGTNKNATYGSYNPTIGCQNIYSTSPAAVFWSSTLTAATPTVVAFNTATTGDNTFIEFGTEVSYTARGSIDYNRAGGLVRYNTTSDYRAKDIIGPVQNPGATIDALKVYEGVMKGATQSRPMLIAHEAQEHAPYAVSGVKDEINEDGTPRFQQIDVSSLVPLLIAEIQFLRARVAALELR